MAETQIEARTYRATFPCAVNPPECHLLVFWRWPQDGGSEILARVREHFTIRSAAHLYWSPARIVENFQRFYAMASGRAYEKHAAAGASPFLLLLVEDPAPVYRYRVAGGSGYKLVNARSFALKQHFRRHGMSLHATNTRHEFRRDLMYLLGLPAIEYAVGAARWDGTIQKIHRDIVGAEGWASLAEVFAVLNEAVNYVVLRNFEGLPDEHVLGPHGDVDLLVEDADARNRAASILNAAQAAHISVNGRKIYIDLRSVEDFYYDPEWCRQILRNRVLLDGFYAPSLDDYFFSLLYHGHVHKPKISEDYIRRLMQMAEALDLQGITPGMLRDPDSAARMLGDFLRGSGFYLTRPNGCPAYNDGFAGRIEGIPFLYQTASSFYRDVMQSAGTGAADLVSRMNQLSETVKSRKWLLRMLIRRLAAYPGDLRRRRALH